jgi:shikimate dehydrogenase
LKNNICISISEKPGNFGKIIHNAGYEELGLDWIYIPFKITNLENTIKGIRALNIRGCSVSMPFKEKVIPFLDEIDSLAKKIGSVNTIVNNNGILKGYNTDFIGFQKSFKKLHVMKHEKILILGSGGVAKSILVGLQNLKFRNIYICSRNLRNTKNLASKFNVKFIKWDDREDSIFDILINATPIGMKPQIRSMPVSKNFIKSLQCIFDVIVNPKETKLIKTAKDLKIKNQGGYLMALYQGAEQFKLYTTKNPPIDKMKKALNKNLM